MHNKILKKICWAMVLILFTTWSGIPQNAAYAQKTARLNEEERKKAVEKLEKLFDALEEASKEIPHDTFDPQAIIDKVGKDPIKLFEWVRDNTYLVPYRGSLRGPLGVLMDRLGNSLDRALLLHKLLTIGGHKVRLVQGTLSKEQAEEILNKAQPIPPEGFLSAEEQSGKSMDDLIIKYGEKYGLDHVEIQRIAQKLTMEQQNIAEEVAQRVKEQTKDILELVGVPKTDIRTAERVKAIEKLQDHWWVQWKNDSGWTDLDPTLPWAKQKDFLVKGESTYQPDKLTKNHLHLVTIRIVIEQWVDGKLNKEKVFEHTLRPTEIFGERIVLRHVPINWPEDLNLFNEENPLERLNAAVTDEKEWLPFLSVGSQQISKYSFTSTGEVREKPGQEPTKGIGKNVGGVFGAFGGTLSGSPPEEMSMKNSYLTAEWIEYDISVPNEQVRTIRRQIFDLIGPAARVEKRYQSHMEIKEEQRLARGLSLLGENQLIIQVCHLSAAFINYLLTIKILSNREAFLSVIDQFEFTKDPTKAANSFVPLPGPEYSLALARHEWSSKRNDIYLDRPNILSYLKSLRQTLRGKIRGYRAFDIIANDVAVRWQSEFEPFKIRLEHGVLDTNAEASLLGELKYQIENTAVVFNLAKALGINWLSIQGMEDSIWQHIDMHRDVRVRIKRDLENGYVVLVPKEAIPFQRLEIGTWWRIDPTTGTTLGLSEQGWGQAKTWYALIVKFLLFAIGILCLDLIPDTPWDNLSVNYRIMVLMCVVGVYSGIATVGASLSLKAFIHYLIVIAGGFGAYIWSESEQSPTMDEPTDYSTIGPY